MGKKIETISKKKHALTAFKLTLGIILVYKVWILRKTLEAKQCLVAIQ